ncbi:MAG TPA: hypothetical protein VGR61_01015, partial [Candidatus Dormibacteraeota bacterium]|nr:hypothetical protein [Candidatus Dormibacteraeota bacterium]
KVQAQTSHDEVKDIAFVDACHGWAVTESNGIMAFVDPTSCLPAPSPTASTAPVGLPKAGHGPIGDIVWVVGALALVLAAGGAASLRRASRS